MIFMRNRGFALKFLVLILCAAVSISVFYTPEINNAQAAEETELRGVWVSTIANIDYPPKATTDSGVLKNEIDKVLDNCEAMGFNAIFFQVRPCGDAFYKSEIFPWSKYLTGKQGLAPNDDFDPLQYIVEKAHERGMQLHAWINPYRITNSSSDNGKLAANNPAVLNPGIVLTDGSGKMYYNPGDSTAMDIIVRGAVEIVEKYDVDGLHMDDYFYPDGNFNDDVTYSFYKDQYPDRDNWRRENVNKLVRTLDEKLHAVRPEIQFGISPRGIWANKSQMAEGSNTKGSSSYFDIFADSRAWVKNEWVDYIMPQLYWNIGYEIADYSVLSDWWADVVEGTDVKLYIGEGAYRTTSSSLPAWKGSAGTNELRTHILNGRENPNISGYCCFTYNDFLENSAIYDLMKEVNTNKVSAPSGAVAVDKPIDSEGSAPGIDDGGSDVKEETDTNKPANDVNDGMSNVDEKPVDVENYKNKFTDMNQYWWAMDSINDLAAHGIIKGRSETEFDPNANITRADNTVLLLRVLGKTAEFTENFDDVYEGKYYYDEIGMAKALGIASGVGNNCFDPDASIRRQDMATLAYRVLTQEGLLTTIPNTTVLNKYSDSDEIYFYAREAIAACIDKGLMSGYGDGTIMPNKYASRVEVALFMHRIWKLIK